MQLQRKIRRQVQLGGERELVMKSAIIYLVCLYFPYLIVYMVIKFYRYDNIEYVDILHWFCETLGVLIVGIIYLLYKNIYNK